HDRYRARSAAGANRHGFPALSSLAASDGARERRAATIQGRPTAARRGSGSRRRLAGEGAYEPQGGRVPRTPVRRPAATGRDRAGTGTTAKTAAVRRADLRA